MSNTYYDSQLTAAEIEAALEAIDNVIVPANNGKVLAVENGVIVAKDVSEYTDISVLVPKSIVANGNYNPATDDADGYSSVAVNVPNSYSASDEGKVVSNGALVSQTSDTKTANGTYDTTLNNEIVVNVQSSEPTIQPLSVTQNGTYTAPSGVDGYSPVNVNVSGGGGGNTLLYDYGELFGDVSGVATTSLAVTLKDHSGYKALIIIMHRGAVTVSGGAVLVNSTKSENYNQWISIYEVTKNDNSTITCTITQASSARMCAVTMYVNPTLTLSAPVQQHFDSGSTMYQYTIPRSSNGKARLLVINHPWSGSTTSTIITPPNVALLPDMDTFKNTGRLQAAIISNIDNVFWQVNTVLSGETSEDFRYDRAFLYDITV